MMEEALCARSPHSFLSRKLPIYVLYQFPMLVVDHSSVRVDQRTEKSTFVYELCVQKITTIGGDAGEPRNL